jgi:hypothetical protein
MTNIILITFLERLDILLIVLFLKDLSHEKIIQTSIIHNEV